MFLKTFLKCIVMYLISLSVYVNLKVQNIIVKVVNQKKHNRTQTFLLNCQDKNNIIQLQKRRNANSTFSSIIQFVTHTLTTRIGCWFRPLTRDDLPVHRASPRLDTTSECASFTSMCRPMSTNIHPTRNRTNLQHSHRQPTSSATVR